MPCREWSARLRAVTVFALLWLPVLALLVSLAPRPRAEAAAGYCLGGQAGERVKAALESLAGDADLAFAGLWVVETGIFLRVAQRDGESLLWAESQIREADSPPTGLVFAWRSGPPLPPPLLEGLNRQTAGLGPGIWRACRPGLRPGSEPENPPFLRVWAASPTPLFWAKAAFLGHLLLLVLLVRRKADG